MFSGLGLVELTFDEKTGDVASTTNLTILNVFLLRLGPMREDSLTRVLISTQASPAPLSLSRSAHGSDAGHLGARYGAKLVLRLPRVLSRESALRCCRPRECGDAYRCFTGYG